MAHVETARTRRRYIEEAGWKTTSGLSVLAGTLVAFGAVALVAAGAGAAGSALGLDAEGISTTEWRQAGIAGAAVGALVLFGSFFFGGYTAGRMSRRAGARHGLLVFLLSVLLVGTVALVAWAVSPDVDLRGEGIPTDRDTWGDIGLGAAIAAGAAMLLGSILGGIRGDRWHGRLATAVVEHREAERESGLEAIESVRVIDGTEPIDLRTDDDRTVVREPSVEEEREAAQS
jgi:hypothetical protein